MSRDRVENRARLIYDFLGGHLTKGYTMPDLCRALGIENSDTTRAAIRRARDMAVEDGLHFPPAVPETDPPFVYMVTNLPGDAFDPTLHMSRIKQGVAHREGVGLDFLRRNLRGLPNDLRPLVKSVLATDDMIRRFSAEMLARQEEVVKLIIGLRRSQRDALGDD